MEQGNIEGKDKREGDAETKISMFSSRTTIVCFSFFILCFFFIICVSGMGRGMGQKEVLLNIKLDVKKKNIYTSSDLSTIIYE